MLEGGQVVKSGFSKAQQVIDSAINEKLAEFRGESAGSGEVAGVGVGAASDSKSNGRERTSSARLVRAQDACCFFPKPATPKGGANSAALHKLYNRL